MQHRIKVIFNPHANHGRNTHMGAALQRQTAYQDGADWAVTEYFGHASLLASEAGRQGYNRIVSIGGDGTVHEIVNGLMSLPDNQRPELAILPVGSGNDFVRGALKDHRRSKNLEQLFGSEQIYTIDIGHCQIKGSDPSYWVNALGIGFDAAVNIQSRRLIHMSGMAMYFVAAVRSIIEDFDAPDMQINLDEKILHQRVQMLTIGNGPREGGGFLTTPDSKINDGWLDYALVEPVSRAMMVRLLPEVMRGTHGRFRQVQLGRLRTIKVNADRPLLIHADGETVACQDDNVREVQVEIVPGAIKLVL